MSANDIFRLIRTADAATLNRIIDRLEMRGRDATFGRFRQGYIDALGISAGQRLLDLGCGTGVTTRLLHTAPDVQTVGIDLSEPLLEAARRLARDAGLDGSSTYQVGEAETIPFADRSFDGAIADTLLAHVADPERAIAEAARVLKPGGKLVLFDGDYGTLAFGGTDPQLGGAIVDAIRKAIYTCPMVVRDIPRLLRTCGLSLEVTLANVYADVGEGGFFWSFAQTYAPLAAKNGDVPEDRVQHWLADQQRAREEKLFFASCNYYAFIARRVD